MEERAMRSFTLLLLVTGIIVPVHAQDAGVSNTDDEQVVQQFLDRKAAAQARRDARLAKQAAGADDRELRRLIRATGIALPKTGLKINVSQEEALQTSLVTDAAQLLALIDLRPGKIRKLEQGGFKPLEAAINYIRGSGSLLDQAILSDRTVVASVRSVKAEDRGDGFGSTVVLEVSDTLVGPTAPPKVIVRQRSGKVKGEDIFYTNDFVAEDKRTYLLSLSRGAYDDDATTSGGATITKPNGRPRYYSSIGVRFVTDGDTATPLFGTGGPTSVAAAKSQLAGLAKVRVDQSINETPGPEESQ
jgi:hypothetical protein